MMLLPVLFIIALAVFPGSSFVNAYAQVGEDELDDGHDHEELAPVAGTYVSRDGLTEIGFPNEWSGFEIEHESVIAAITSKGATGLSAEPDFDVPIIMLITSEGKSNAEITTNLIASASDERVICTLSKSWQAWINGAIGTASEASCTADGEKLLMKSLLIETTTNMVMAAYVSPEASYEDSIAEFSETLRSFKVFNAVEPSLSQSLNSSYYEINAANTLVTLEVLSSSSVPEFTLDEANRQILVQVNEQGNTPGVAIVPAGIVLEGPYSISVDGEAIDVDTPGMLLRSEPTGEEVIKVSYPPGQHAISITGARVVPEFASIAASTISVLALALVLGLVHRAKGS